MEQYPEWQPIETVPIEKAFEDFIRAVERSAFSIPAPNPYTPRLMGLCAEARSVLYSHLTTAVPASEAEKE